MKQRIVAFFFFLVLVFSLCSCDFLQNEKDTREEKQMETVNCDLNETTNCFGLEVTVKGCSFVKCDNNNKYCIVDATLRNPNKEAVQLSESFHNTVYNTRIVYNGEYTYYSSFGTDAKYLAYRDIIKPLETIDGIYQFQLPNEVADDESGTLVFIFAENKAVRDIEYSWTLK